MRRTQRAISATATIALAQSQQTNFALASNGATVSASSTYGGQNAGSATNGDRKGLSTAWWTDDTSNVYPDWLEVNFAGAKTINEIDVFGLQQNWATPVEPTEQMVSSYALTSFEVQYWTGNGWTNVPGGSVTGNDKVWRKFTFASLTTSRIRVNITNVAGDNHSQVVEVEAWGASEGNANVALAANGATASASSTYSGQAPAANAINGDHRGNNGWWADGTSFGYPDWIQVDFSGLKTIDEIDVFGLQQNYGNPVEPTLTMTSSYALTSFEVQYWTGSAWATVPGGSVSGNDKVWKQFTFTPITTSKIRINVTNVTGDNHSQIVEIEAWGTASASGGSSSDFAMARLDPTNRTGTGGEDLLSNNFNLSFPLVGLPGRELDLGLALSYNSLAWTRSGAFIDYDVDAGSIAPGFRLGFPTIEGPYWNNQSGANFYLLVTPSGGRVELRQVGNSIVYESKDSTYLQLTDNLNGTITLRPTDGSQMNFIGVSGAWRCHQIKDRNGNYITATYKSWGELETVTDTLGRALTFSYDGNANLQSITQTWNGETHFWATFGWGTAAIGNNFPGLNNLGPNSTSIAVLTQVGLPDGSRYNFEYNNSYGMVSTIRHYGSDDHQRNYTTYLAPASAIDCPRLTERRVWAQAWTGVNGVPAEVVTYFGHDADNGCRMTLPDSSVHKEYYGSSWQSGLTIETRSYATVADANSNAWQKKTSTAWTQDSPNVTYVTNPRVTETNVYDFSGNRRRVTIDYSAYAQWGLPHVVKEYAGDGSTELRRSQTDYNLSQDYLDRRIIGLLSTSQLYDAVSAQWQAKVTYGYDDPAKLTSQATTATQHDSTYSQSFRWRGNVTSVSRWDVTDINNSNKALTNALSYNAAGSVVSATDPANHNSMINYADSFADNIDRNTFAYPTSVTDADGFSSTVKYNFDFGAKTRVEGPPPQNQPNGLIQTFTYDSAARLEKVTTANTGAYTRYFYGPYYRLTFSTVNTIADELYITDIFDGVGRRISTSQNHPGSVGGYAAMMAVYDRMGRVAQQTNPTEITGLGVPTGDDAAGWQWNHPTEYDWQGRAKKTYNMDGTYKEASFAGCGCAGGAVATLTDEAGRQQKVYSDVLGRTWKTEVMTWPDANDNRSVYSSSVSVFTARDQVNHVRQYAGVAPAEASSTNSAASCPTGTCQETVMTLDGYGRLQSKHVPEQNAGTATVYAYNVDDTIQSVTDARGASVTYGYNNRHLVTSINYFAPTGITPTPNVTLGFDAAGNRTSMNDGSGSTSYTYDQLSRMSSETRSFTGLSGSYAINYGYNLAGALTSLTEPSQFGASVSYAYDSIGRLSAVAGSGMQVSSLMSSLQYRASGALKHAAYGDGTELNLSYNERQLLTRYELNNVKDGTASPYPYTTMGSQNQYHADGRVSYTQDLRNGNFDRGYTYDHAARLAVATSGREARGEAPANPADSPYKQTFSYDAWNNMGRVARLWTDGQGDSPTYTNNRRSDSYYDAQGNALSTPHGKTHDYDAASLQVSFNEESWSGPVENQVYHQNTVVQTYGGDGEAGKRIETRRSEDMQNHVTLEVRTVYFLRSSVLGGAVISELNDQGQIEGHVYVGGQKIADYAGGSMTFRHTNPSNGNWVNVQMPSNWGTRTEFDPLGASVGAENPFPSNSSYNDMVGSEWLYNELGNPFDLASGCGRLDGMPISCSELHQRMESGLVESEYSGLRMQDPNQPYRSNERTRMVTLRMPIKSYGLGIFEIWMPPEFRGNDNIGFSGGYVVYVAPQEGNLGPRPKRGPYVDREVLNYCTWKHFGVTLNSFNESRSDYNGSFTGTGRSVLPSIPNDPDGRVTFTIENITHYSNEYLTRKNNSLAIPGEPTSGPIMGLTLRDRPRRNYTGYDNSPMQILMTQVHELGHSLDAITGKGYDISERHNGKKDLAGKMLENCVRKNKGFKQR